MGQKKRQAACFFLRLTYTHYDPDPHAPIIGKNQKLANKSAPIIGSKSFGHTARRAANPIIEFAFIYGRCPRFGAVKRLFSQVFFAVVHNSFDFTMCFVSRAC